MGIVGFFVVLAVGLSVYLIGRTKRAQFARLKRFRDNELRVLFSERLDSFELLTFALGKAAGAELERGGGWGKMASADDQRDDKVAHMKAKTNLIDFVQELGEFSR